MRRYFLFVGIIFVLFFIVNIRYFEFEVSIDNSNDSIIGLTIDGNVTNTFPGIDSGLTIGSIHCDKGVTGVWDYKNWTLKIRNISQNRTKCQVNFVSQYSERILNGTDPVLKDGLIPVEISDNGTVTRAKLKDDWYSYQNQKWANAVILNDDVQEYFDGDVIPEDAIESYFVWIPRYRYQIFNIGNYTGLTTNVTNIAKEIQIEFENKDVVKSTGSGYGEWLTHPAFTSFDVNGMWVGKFETGYKDANNVSEAEKNENNPSKIQIKPNVYSWRSIQVANAYLSSFNYKREYDSHMMKNTEWGAVAYLSHSKYGSSQTVRVNNHSDFITGYGAVEEPKCVMNEECNKKGTTSDVTMPWNTNNGYFASTTGNISGIYDMSGGAYEYVMGVMLNSTNTTPCSGNSVDYHSGFKGPYCSPTESEFNTNGVDLPSSKYYDSYLYSTLPTTYNRRILGDATGEMGPFQNVEYGNQFRLTGSWYFDEGWFVSCWYPWFFRGGDQIGTLAGIFAFRLDSGADVSFASYRVVLSM